MTPQGGHLGWLAGSEAPFGAPWTDTVAMDFLELLQAGKTKIPNGVSDQTMVATGNLSVGDMEPHPPIAVPVQ